LEWQAELVGFFFDQSAETPFSATSFKEWLQKDLAPLVRAYRDIRVNAMVQEHESQVPRLNYLIQLALISLVAEITSDYFERQILLHSRLAVTARLCWGRCLAWSFGTVENSAALARLRMEKLGQTQADPAGSRLLNPFLLTYVDAGDAVLIEETLLRVNPYKLSPGLRHGLSELLAFLITHNKKLAIADLRRTLAEPRALDALLAMPAFDRQLARQLRRQKDLRIQLVWENVCDRLRQNLRAYSLEHPQAAEVLALASSDRNLSEVLAKPGAGKRLIKALQKQSLPWEDLKLLLKESAAAVKRSRHGFWNPLSGWQLLQEARSGLQRLSRFLSEAEDFRICRGHYARDSRREKIWQGLRLWRAFEMIVQEQGKTDSDRIQLAPIWVRRKADIENNFAEGNLFLCVPAGEIYPLNAQKRGQVIFMFADLRNSTETTMKLTKDTASYLAPYLTTVNSAARSCHGERIYFAGDGFAAYYAKAVDAVRAGFILVSRFQELQEVSKEQLRQKARELYLSAGALGLPLMKPGKIAQLLPEVEKKGAKPELLEFLRGLAAMKTEDVTEDHLRSLLARVASGYTMPRVDIGIALTMGELFFALVGEEAEEKIPIVISPQLTQAARLSGSADAVKNYIDTHFPQPFPFSVYAWDKKLYNRGIVITEQLFSHLQQEIKIGALTTADPVLVHEQLFGYFDHQLNRRIILRKNQETVLLKGIAEPCAVYEVGLPGSYLDKQFGAIS
jgi:class 3 adenylate cyclase